LLPFEITDKISDEILRQIWDIWKEKREKRKNRPFIRDFWSYQQDNCDDNYVVFKTQEAHRQRPMVREKIK